ncbi:MAG TPA: hypothetical protein GX008_02420 [Firmicutes bacterium]|jgi:hypothetical protein|nr:MAG: hypothetical protein AA931_02845 [Peptococcaceae bacterium 1109]HHT72551.1 hypothetical protein [Bacillota bacterium]
MWVDEQQTLWEERNRDIWQLPIISDDGEYCGNVIAQIVEPQEYLVRYLVVFSKGEQKHYLLPSDTVERIDQVVQCKVEAAYLRELPPFGRQISRQFEEEVYKAIGLTPYWE